MTITFAILFAVSLALLIFLALKNQRLEAELNRVNTETQQAIAAAEKAGEDRVSLVRQQAEAAVSQAQRIVDQQFTQFQQDADRVREYYEVEARKVQAEASAQAAEIIAELEPLRRYQHLRDAEQQAHQALSIAMNEASVLRTEAQSLLEQARNAARAERTQALQRAKSLREQADALLNQATKDAGRIIAESEKRAEEIGGDAYRALREKDTLGQAVEALRNVVEGYGNKYLVPTHSLLDDLAAEFGYAAAGESLRSARDLSRRMVEQGDAAACDYVEAVRKNTAVQFVVHAFNGRVDAILSRVRYDNYGILDQQIRDAFSL